MRGACRPRTSARIPTCRGFRLQLADAEANASRTASLKQQPSAWHQLLAQQQAGEIQRLLKEQGGGAAGACGCQNQLLLLLLRRGQGLL